MLIDISRRIKSGMLSYPGDPPVRLRRDPDLERGGQYSFTCLDMHSHCGTHLDAPAHFIRGGRCIEDYSPYEFCPLVEVLDCRGLLDISAADLSMRIMDPDAALLLRTDAGDFPDEQYIAEHPGLSEDAARLLVDRGPRLLGIDYLSVERDGDGSFPVHMKLLGAGFLLLEYIDLRHVEPGIYRLLCLPLRLTEAEAAPCRAMLTDAAVTL